MNLSATQHDPEAQPTTFLLRCCEVFNLDLWRHIVGRRTSCEPFLEGLLACLQLKTGEVGQSSTLAAALLDPGRALDVQLFGLSLLQHLVMIN